MSVRAMEWVWGQEVAQGGQKLVLTRLCWAADDEGFSFYGQTKMAKECGISRSTLQAHLAALRGMGLIQVEERRRADGGRRSNRYRVLGPWVESAQTQERATPARRSGTETTEEPTTKATLLPPQPLLPLTGIESLGQRRYRVPSSSVEGVKYVADLVRGQCTCQAKRGCRHLATAKHYEETAQADRSKEFRDAIWDALVDVGFGAPTKRGEADRGRQVSELAELLTAEQVERTPERWAEEVKARHRALEHEWGVSRVTLNSFVTNWPLAGRLVRGRQDNTVEHDERVKKLSRYTRPL